MDGLRVGLIGAGGIAGEHLSAWLRLGAQVSVHSHAGAEELVAAHGGGRVVDGLDELFEASAWVDIVVPTPAHADLAAAALRAGKDVVCEKPLARTPEQAWELVDLAAETNRRLFPAHVVRYFGQYQAMREAIAQGMIGRPAIARLARASAHPAWAEWFADPEQSGGVVFDLMVHDLDIAEWTLGTVVEAHATTGAGRAPSGAPVEVAQAVLTHAGGELTHVLGYWGPPGTTFRTSFHISGDDGALSHDTREKEDVVVNLAETRGGQMLPDLSGVESPYLSELREFVSAPAPRVDAVDGARAVELAAAVAKSAADGVPTPLPSRRRASGVAR